MIFKQILEGSERKIGKTLRATVGYQKSVVPQKPSENSVSRRRGQRIKRCQWAKRRMENWPKDLILEVKGILDKSRLRRVGVEKSKVEGD